MGENSNLDLEQEEQYLTDLYAMAMLAEDDGDEEQAEVLRWAIRKIEQTMG
jgi:hypothetical protein